MVGVGVGVDNFFEGFSSGAHGLSFGESQRRHVKSSNDIERPKVSRSPTCTCTCTCILFIYIQATTTATATTSLSHSWFYIFHDISTTAICYRYSKPDVTIQIWWMLNNSLQLSIVPISMSLNAYSGSCNPLILLFLLIRAFHKSMQSPNNVPRVKVPISALEVSYTVPSPCPSSFFPHSRGI